MTAPQEQFENPLWPRRTSCAKAKSFHIVEWGNPPSNVTLGLYRNRSVEKIGGNQATFDNSQRNNLRSLCVGVGSVW